MAAGVPPVLGLCASALVFAMGAQHERPAPGADELSVPRELADYSHFTGTVSDSPPGRATALFQHGYGVEFLDYPQAVVLGAGGDTYRRVDLAEDRAGGETQGDPAPMLLSPDGRYVAVGDHDTVDPDVVIVDLTTGTVSTHPLPSGRSVIPVAWSSDGQSLANLISSDPTNPYLGERITGDVGILDLSSDDTTLLEVDDATAVAFSPDGLELAVERAHDGGVDLTVVDQDAERDIAADGVLAGPTAWSPDGRLLAITTVEPAGPPVGIDDPGIPTGLSFVDATGAGGDVPEPFELPLVGPGRVLGWDGPDAVVMMLAVEGTGDPCCGTDEYTLSSVPIDGSEPTTLMRIDDLQSYGVGRFQLAAVAADRLEVVSPDGVDRGPWPLGGRITAAVLGGLAVWLVAWLVLRIAGRRLARRHS